jgi:hypothetical protein
LTEPGTSWIAERQHADGGWGYGGVPWTESTALALLALNTEPKGHAAAVQAAVGWLRQTRRSDNGWPPNPQVDRSVTWATSLALLALSGSTGEPCTESVRWLLDTAGAENSFTMRFMRMFAAGKGEGEGFEGWPWFPGTTAWVAPTGLAIRALERTRSLQTADVGRRMGERLQSARDFLLVRRCLDGGWNHGAAHPLGYDAESYPETTGVALLGLTGTPAAALERSLKLAAGEFTACRSAQGRAWLRIGLAAHSQPVPTGGEEPVSRTVTDAALAVLAHAAEQGKGPFAR